MGYYPTLLIRKTDLEKNRDHIEEAVHSDKLKEAKKDAYLALYAALGVSTIKFPELELVIIKPELTNHNMEVRKLLNKLNIDFRTEN